jgi:hypothetical protein
MQRFLDRFNQGLLQQLLVDLVPGDGRKIPIIFSASYFER